MDNKIEKQSYKFALRIVRLYDYLKERKLSYGLGDQVFRSGTSIGANVSEAKFAQSPADFIAKLSIALKEANETKYWLNLLRDSEYIESEHAESILSDCSDIVGTLVNIIKSTKRSQGIEVFESKNCSIY